MTDEVLLAVPPAAGGARTAGDFSVETLARFLAAVRTKVAWLEVERARLRATAGGGRQAAGGRWQFCVERVRDFPVNVAPYI